MPTEFILRLQAICQAFVLGASLLGAPAFAAKEDIASRKPIAASAVKAPTARTKAQAAPSATAARKAGEKSAVKSKAPQEPKPGTLAEFGKEEPTAEVAHVANWVSYTRNNGKKAFVVIDKKAARLYVFDPLGKLRSSTPVLLGKAVGDHSVPGIGDKPLSQIKEDEKTTPAGRFLAQPGKNTHGDDIIWIDYNAAVSMHRLRKVSAEERRAERMATADVSDNRISNGCVNVPPGFYNSVLKPTVIKMGAIVYVLPETKTPQQQFGSYDVAAKAKTGG